MVAESAFVVVVVQTRALVLAKEPPVWAEQDTTAASELAQVPVEVKAAVVAQDIAAFVVVNIVAAVEPKP